MSDTSDERPPNFPGEMLQLLGMDFGRVESRMLIQYMTMKSDGTFVYTPIDPKDFYRDVDQPRPLRITGTNFSLVIIDEFADICPEPVEPQAPPMKQNGRSAAYLAHDPTKRHKRRR